MPCLVIVIPTMDHINKTLTTNSFDNKLKPSIHAALRIAKKTLNRYYNATDQLEVYHIAMGTQLNTYNYFSKYYQLTYFSAHPHHKLQYFKQVGWELEWIKTAG